MWISTSNENLCILKNPNKCVKNTNLVRLSALIKCELVRLKSANCCLKKIWMLFSKLMRFMWEKYELVHLENVTKNNESRNAFWKRFFEKFAFQFTIVHFFLKCCQKFLLRKKVVHFVFVHCRKMFIGGLSWQTTPGNYAKMPYSILFLIFTALY